MIFDWTAKIRDFNGVTGRKTSRRRGRGWPLPLAIVLPLQPLHYVQNCDTAPIHATRIEFKQGFLTDLRPSARRRSNLSGGTPACRGRRARRPAPATARRMCASRAAGWCGAARIPLAEPDPLGVGRRPLRVTGDHQIQLDRGVCAQRVERCGAIRVVPARRPAASSGARGPISLAKAIRSARSTASAGAPGRRRIAVTPRQRAGQHRQGSRDAGGRVVQTGGDCGSQDCSVVFAQTATKSSRGSAISADRARCWTAASTSSVSGVGHTRQVCAAIARATYGNDASMGPVPSCPWGPRVGVGGGRPSARAGAVDGADHGAGGCMVQCRPGVCRGGGVTSDGAFVAGECVAVRASRRTLPPNPLPSRVDGIRTLLVIRHTV